MSSKIVVVFFNFNLTNSNRKNVCKLQVFYEELNLEVITERRSYEVCMLMN